MLRIVTMPLLKPLETKKRIENSRIDLPCIISASCSILCRNLEGKVTEYCRLRTHQNA